MINDRPTDAHEMSQQGSYTSNIFCLIVLYYSCISVCLNSVQSCCSNQLQTGQSLQRQRRRRPRCCHRRRRRERRRHLTVRDVLPGTDSRPSRTRVDKALLQRLLRRQYNLNQPGYSRFERERERDFSY